MRKVVRSALRRLGARKGPRLPEPAPNRHVLRLYADYNQFYLGDSAFDHANTQLWSQEAHERRLDVVPPSFLAVGTHRFDYVPVVVEIEQVPAQEDLGDWQHVVEASLSLPSGRLAIDACSSYLPERWPDRLEGSDASPHISLPPGTYRVRVCYAGLDTLDEDHYHVVLWPQEPYEPPRVLRAYSPEHASPS